VIAPKVLPDTKPVIRIDKEIEKIEIEIEKTVVNSNPEDQNKGINLEITESNAKKLIAERKYKEAIEILRALNLNNPKKSVYFADQIRFLEKVIVNSKK